jgi:hypothetical protein
MVRSLPHGRDGADYVPGPLKGSRQHSDDPNPASPRRPYEMDHALWPLPAGWLRALLAALRRTELVASGSRRAAHFAAQAPR